VNTVEKALLVPVASRCAIGRGLSRFHWLSILPQIHLNSHTGEKREYLYVSGFPLAYSDGNSVAFVCTFEGCGRSFSVLSNMRRHARVHVEVSGRQNDASGDELSDRHSPA